MTIQLQHLPIVYSLRHCPYAMRARLAIFKSKQPILLRDIKLNNKPPEMLALSSDGTVPLLVMPNSLNINTPPEVVEESLDIMLKVLSVSDPSGLLVEKNGVSLADMHSLIKDFDTGLIPANEAYKCAKRYKESNLNECRQACEVYLQKLEERLEKYQFLLSDDESLVDIALMPFIRQFSKVERQWYQQSPYSRLRAWLNRYLQSSMYTKVMAEYPLWIDNHQEVIFGDI